MRLPPSKKKKKKPITHRFNIFFFIHIRFSLSTRYYVFAIIQFYKRFPTMLQCFFFLSKNTQYIFEMRKAEFLIKPSGTKKKRKSLSDDAVDVLRRDR